MIRKQRKELLNRDQEIQQLMAQINKKDFKLQTLESRLVLADEQQRESIHRLQHMLTEKDKTIKVMLSCIMEPFRILFAKN